jgi:hypothetical protein
MPLSDTRQPRLRLRKRGAGRGNKRDAAPAPPPAARWFKPQFHDARLRQCSGTRDVGVGQPTSRREDLQRVQIGSVALEDSVGQEYEPVFGFQLEFLTGYSASTAIPNGKSGAKSIRTTCPVTKWPSRAPTAAPPRTLDHPSAPSRRRCR